MFPFVSGFVKVIVRCAKAREREENWEQKYKKAYVYLIAKFFFHEDVIGLRLYSSLRVFN